MLSCVEATLRGLVAVPAAIVSATVTTALQRRTVPVLAVITIAVVAVVVVLIIIPVAAAAAVTADGHRLPISHRVITAGPSPEIISKDLPSTTSRRPLR
jgi:asparagine N-glycosylation enzyme membrane subunit Stt3